MTGLGSGWPRRHRPRSIAAASLLLASYAVSTGGVAAAETAQVRVGIAPPGTGNASALNEVLKKGGLAYGDVQTVYLGFPEHLAAYRNKAIDASITNEPTMTRAIEEGVAVRVAGNDVTYPEQQTAV